MKIKIPYVTTTPVQDLKITFALTPLWWLLGLYFIMYHFAVFLSLAKMIILRSQDEKQISVPKLSLWLLVFLVLFLLTIFVNSFENNFERTLSALNNFSVWLMGFGLIIVIYNSATHKDIVDFMRIAAYLAMIGGVLALLFLFLWIKGNQNLTYTALSGILIPSLRKYPYFDTLVNITITDTQSFLDKRLPRIPVFTSVMTASGGQMLVLIPFLIGYWAIKKKINFWRIILLTIPFSALILSFARTPIFSMVVISGIILFLNLRLSKKVLILLSVVLFVIPVCLILEDYILDFINLILKARAGSTHTRFELYKEAINVTLERNPIIGIGIKVREEFTKTALGSHSTYIALFIMTGIMGIISFLMFQLSLLINWLKRQRIFLHADRIMWQCFGAAFLGLSLWRFTDTLDAIPYITFLYFLVVAVLISLKKISAENKSVYGNNT